MKIAVWHNLPSGGGKRALYDHVRGLLGRGHTIEAWCPPTADRDYLPLSAMVREHVLPLDAVGKPRFTDFWQITLQIQPALDAMQRHCRLCAEEINTGGFDILFANSCASFATPPIARFVGIPSVLYLGEPFRALYEARPRLKWVAPPDRTTRSRIGHWRGMFADLRELRNDRLQAREEVDSAAAFSRILVNSLFSRESVLRCYGLDADVCYLGIDTNRFADHRLPRDDTVIGLGSVTPLKNIELLIQAVAELPLPRPGVLWIGNISDPDYRNRLAALAAARQVEFESRVSISDDALVDVLNRASMMVYAPRLEPFGLAPLEANACGVPVIAVAEGGVRETIVDGVNGLLVANHPKAVADAMTRLRSDPQLARRLGENGRQAVLQHWSIEAATARIEQRLSHYAS